jgi:hypothetical protein
VTKIIEVEKCEDCPFDTYYPDTKNHVCSKEFEYTMEAIKLKTFPPFCPLKDKES